MANDYRQQAQQVISEVMSALGSRTYVGGRYIPVFADPFEWDSETTYEPLTYVQFDGITYISRSFVPAGISPANEHYWASATIGVQNIQMFRSYATTVEMCSDSALEAGMVCATAGFRSVNDGGAGTYIISATGTANGMDMLQCGDLIATLVVGDSVCPMQLGAYDVTGQANPTDMSHQQLQRAFQISSVVDGRGKTYAVAASSTMSGNTLIDCTLMASTGSVYALTVSAGNNNVLRCSFANFQSGLYCNASANIIITDCTFNNCVSGLSCVGTTIVVITACRFNACETGLYCGGSSKTRAYECKFDSCTTGIGSGGSANAFVCACTFNGCGVPPASSSIQTPRVTINASAPLQVIDCSFDVLGHAISGIVQAIRNCTFKCNPQSGVAFNSRAITLNVTATDAISEVPIVIDGNTIESCYQYGIYVSHGYNEDSGHPKYVISNNVIREVKPYSGAAYAVYVSSVRNTLSFADGGFELMGNSSEFPFLRANDAVVTTDLSLPPAAPYCSPYIRLVGCASISKSDMLACTLNNSTEASYISTDYIAIAPDDDETQPKTYLPFAAHECVGVELVIATSDTLRVHSLRDYDTQEYMVQLPSAESTGYSPLYACFPPSNGCPYFDLSEAGVGWYAYEVGMMKRQCVWNGRQPADSYMVNIGYDGNSRSAVSSKSFIGGVELKEEQPIEKEVQRCSMEST